MDGAEGRKEQQVIVRTGCEHVLDRILVLDFRAFDAFAAATLSSIGADRSPLDVAFMADRNDHVLFLDQVFQIDVSDFHARDFGAARIGQLLLDVGQVVANDRSDVVVVRQDSLVF